MSSEAVAEKSEKKEDTKPKGEEKKPKKEKEDKIVHVKSSKAKPMAAIDPRTGTRFAPGTARMLAFDIVYKGAKEGKNVKEIRDILAKTRKENGSEFDLDIGYVNFVAAYHPEMFDVYSPSGKIVIKKDPTIDKEAAKKFDDDRNAKKKKAEEERTKRKNEAAEGKKKDEKKEDKKEEKSEKKEHKEHKEHKEDKPSKKEKEE